MNRKLVKCVVGLGLALMGSAVQAFAQAPPLGTLEGVAVLGASTVTNTGPTVISGIVGLNPGSSVTGFPPGIVVNGTIHAANAVALQAQSDLTVAYNNLASRPCTVNLTGQDLGGLTLTPGVYCFASSAQLTGVLTLDAQGNSAAVFIFQIGSTLTTASNSSVNVINQGLNCNVFWQIGSSATLGTTTNFAGSIMALTSITLTTGVSVAGRALAMNGAVTLDTNVVNSSSCAVSLPGPSCPTVTLSPATLANATQGTAYSQQLIGGGGLAPFGFGVTSGTPPAGVTLTPGGLLAGTPTVAGSSSFTVRATDVNTCFGALSYALTVLAPVPTLAEWAMIALTALLSGAGFVSLRRRQSSGAGAQPRR